MASPSPAINDSKLTTPAPDFPAGMAAGKTGPGVYRVDFDAQSHAAAVSTLRSAGSNALDQNTMHFALQHWTGRPYGQFIVMVSYPPSDGADRRARILAQVTTPRPPYPYQAKAKQEQGTGVVKVAFDAHGKVSSVLMTKSTGSKILDANTIGFVRANWHSTGGKELSGISLPITYRLR